MDLSSLQRALENVTMERDAAIVTKEDLITQLRVAKRRLHEAEEEQYKAEEDAANLRSELTVLQQLERQPGSYMSSSLPDHQEIIAMKSELQGLWKQLEQEQHKVVVERHRFASLQKEFQALREEYEQSKKPGQADASSVSVTLPLTGASSYCDTGNSLQESTKYEQKLRDLAYMVERLERGRQKLLSEVDSQSLEIERLFIENTSLASSVKEMTDLVAQCESQVKQSLEQNAHARQELSRLHLERASQQSNILYKLTSTTGSDQGQSDVADVQDSHMEQLMRENSNLKMELAKTQAQGDEMAAHVAQLSSSMSRSVLASNSLNRLYRPILSNIENRLLQMRQDVFVPDGLFSGY